MAAEHLNSRPDDASEIWDKDVTLSPTPTVSTLCRTTSASTLDDSSPESRQSEWSFEDGVNVFYVSVRGDWKGFRRITRGKNMTIIRASIIRGGQNVVHVAAGARHVRFMKKLLKFLDKEDLVLKDQNGNTPFSCAVAAGTVKVAEMMLQMNPKLLEIPGAQGRTPLYFAVLFGRDKMASYLYPKLDLDQGERARIFFTSITNELYVFALKMLQDYPELAVARDMNNETALHLLAGKPSAFSIKSSRWKSFIISFLDSMSINKGKNTRTSGLQLLKCLLKEVLWRGDKTDIIRKPSHALFIAAKLGNYEFVAELIGSYPSLIWETDECNRSLFHIAVMYRHASIFNLIFEFGLYKDIILSYNDHKNNNILHLAAKLAPPHQLNILSGPAFQMQRDLLWFEEVKKVVPPSYEEMKNSEGKTPKDIFIEEHKGSLEKGESWMKTTMRACFKPRSL